MGMSQSRRSVEVARAMDGPDRSGQGAELERFAGERAGYRGCTSLLRTRVALTS